MATNHPKNTHLSRNYLQDLDNFRDHRNDLLLLLSSIMEGVASPELFQNEEHLHLTMSALGKTYPFVQLAYLLDADGRQVGNSIYNNMGSITLSDDDGTDLSSRIYYKNVKASNEPIVTSPYLCSVDQSLIVSSAIRVEVGGNTLGYLVLDMDLSDSIRFLIGDRLRNKAEPYFKIVHTVFSFGLFGIVFVLLLSATLQMLTLFDPTNIGDYTKPLTAIIYMTLGMAIFDLAKTTFEEEVLTHKDIFRHSTIRRIITRFMSSILIAVSIEALLLMFKGAMGTYELMSYAAWLMLAAVFLLLSLGAYVWMGAQAEAILKENQPKQKAPLEQDRRQDRRAKSSASESMHI